MTFVPGSYVDVTGFSSGANNGQKLVTTRSSSKFTVASSLANETVSVPALDPPQVTISMRKVTSVPAGSVARLFLLRDACNSEVRVWGAHVRAHSSTLAVLGGPTAGYLSPCDELVPVPPVPPPPPPPYHGQSCDLSACAATRTVTIAAGTGTAVAWNGVHTVTKTGTPAYYRVLLTDDKVIDLRCFVNGGGYGYKWQVQLKDPSRRVPNKRFGNNDSGGCPPLASYTCFAVPSEAADCTTGGSPTCVVSA